MCVHISVWVDEIIIEVREGFQTLVDHLVVEVLCYIPQSLIRVFEVPVTKIRFGKTKWKVLHWRQWWILNRSEHIITWCCGSSLWLSIICIGMVFHVLMWWFTFFGNLFCAVWHASFRVQEHWQVSAAHIVPLSFVPGDFWIRMLVKIREKLY